MPTRIHYSSSLYPLVLISLFSVVIFSVTQKSVHRLRAVTAVHSRWKLLQDGICYLAVLQASTPLQPDVVQWWFQPQAFKGCSSALSHSLAKEPVYKVFSKTHLLKPWVNQGFIKCPIRCKIHFSWSCKGNFCNRIKRSHCQILQRTNVYRLRPIPSFLLELQPHSQCKPKQN